MGWSERYGASWSERSMDVVERVGVFDLALLESVLRAADVRCSRSLGGESAYARVKESPTPLVNEAENPELEDDDNELESHEVEVMQ